jgi:hypothetical protein
MIRLPEYTRLLRERHLRAVRELGMQNEAQTKSVGQEAPCGAEIADYLGISLRQIERVWLGLGERAPGVDHAEASTDSQTAEDYVIEHEERAAVHAALQRLSPFEAWVIRERFGLGEWSPNPIVSSYSCRNSASHSTADQVRIEPPSPSAKAARPSHYYYGRSYLNLSRDCGLSVHRLRLTARTALDKLRCMLSPVAAHGL